MAALEQTGPAGTDASGRGRLVQALGEIPGESAINLLRSLLDDPDAAVARTARYLLGMPMLAEWLEEGLDAIGA